MIDVENDVYSYVARQVRTAVHGIIVSNEYAETVAKFPAVTIVQADSMVLSASRTAASIENAVTLMYQVDIYSNKAAGKKAEAKKIMSVVDEAFAALGFTRIMGNQIPNLRDATIYRITCRYEGVVVPETADGKTIYRVYQR